MQRFILSSWYGLHTETGSKFYHVITALDRLTGLTCSFAHYGKKVFAPQSGQANQLKAAAGYFFDIGITNIPQNLVPVIDERAQPALVYSLGAAKITEKIKAYSTNIEAHTGDLTVMEMRSWMKNDLGAEPKKIMQEFFRRAIAENPDDFFQLDEEEEGEMPEGSICLNEPEPADESWGSW